MNLRNIFFMPLFFCVSLMGQESISYYPAENKYAALLFEDNFPCKGDWDFNDLVLRYNVAVTTNESAEVTKLIWRNSITAVGASYDNGLSIELPFIVNDPSEISISDSSGSAFICSSLDANCDGTVSTQESQGISRPLILRFYISEKDHTGRSKYLNTYNINNSKNSSSNPVDWTVAISFNNPVAILDQTEYCSTKAQALDCKHAMTPPYNPFLTINGNLKHEVHLPYYSATDYYKKSYDKKCHHRGSGCGDLNNANSNSNSNSTNNEKCFTTNSGLPWVLEVSSIDYDVTGAWPKEKKDITDVFTGSEERFSFVQWADSGGADCSEGDQCKWWESAVSSRRMKLDDLGNYFKLERGEHSSYPLLSCKKTADSSYFVTTDYTTYNGHGLNVGQHQLSKTFQADWNQIINLDNNKIENLCTLLAGKTNSYWVLKNNSTNYSSTRPYYIKSNETKSSAAVHGYVILYADGTRTTGYSTLSWGTLENALGGCTEVDGNCVFSNISCYLVLESWGGNRRTLGFWPSDI